MTHREQIRTKVGTVKSETQSLLKRLREERLAKARQRRPVPVLHVVEAVPQADESVDPALDGFAAGPGVDRFFADAGAPAAPAPADAPPAIMRRPAPTTAPGRPPTLCPGTLIGLEPVIVRGVEGRRQPEPRLTPVDGNGEPIKSGTLPPLLETGAPTTRSTPRPEPRQMVQVGVKTRSIDPSALGLEPVYGGNVKLTVPVPDVKSTPTPVPTMTKPATPRAPASPSPSPTRPEVRPARDLPLATISAIGPGLAWKLQNLGILSLGDLATADPVALRNGLGPLGTLVRLDLWIEEAKQILASRTH